VVFPVESAGAFGNRWVEAGEVIGGSCSHVKSVMLNRGLILEHVFNEEGQGNMSNTYQSSKSPHCSPIHRPH
jgi:hypothetical protein